MPKISALPSMTAPDGADPAPIVDDSVGSTKKITLTAMKEWLQSLAGWISTAMIASAAVTPPKWRNLYKFSAYRAAAHTSANFYQKVSFDTTAWDTSSNLTTNNRFVAPVAGYYHFDAVCGNTAAGATAIFTALYKNGVSAKIGAGANTAPNGAWSGVHANLLLAAADYVEVYFIGGNGSTMEVGANKCYFEGFIISET